MLIKLKKIILDFLPFLFPAIIIFALQAFMPDRKHLLTSIPLGLIFSIIFYFLMGRTVKYFFEDCGLITKYAIICTSFLILLPLPIPVLRTVWFYCLVLLMIFAMVLKTIFERVKNEYDKLGLILTVFSLTVLAILYLIVAEKFTSDSYSIYEMSKTIFSEFGKINTYRQYIITTDRGISFPYLMPLFIAVVDKFTGLGINSGAVINLFASILTAYYLCKISKKLLGTVLAGGIACTFLFCNMFYFYETAAARTIPLSLMCICIAFYLLLDLPDTKKSNIFVAGIILGAAAVIRFDSIFICAITGLVIFLFSKGIRIKNALVFASGLIIFASPWIVYSFKYFGVPWISDNSGTLFMLRPENPQRFYSSSYAVKTLFNAPLDWVKQLITYKILKVGLAFFCCVLCSAGSYISVWLFVHALKNRRKINKKFFADNKRYFRVLSVIFTIYILKTSVLIIIGYDDFRYHLDTVAMFILMIAGAVCLLMYNQEDKIPKKKTKQSMHYILLCALISFGLAIALIPSIHRSDSALLNYIYPAAELKSCMSPVLREDVLTITKDSEIIRDAVTENNSNPRVLFIGSRLSYEFGVYTGITAYAEIFSLPDDKNAIYEMIENVSKPDYIVSPNADSQIVEKYNLKLILDEKQYNIYEVLNKSYYK